jgi:hypothetical protein
MNGLDDDDIGARLSSLFDDEPPMESAAADDLARGRRLLRRRRRGAVLATATALPAVLVGGWAVGTATLGSSGSASRLQPADGSEPSDAGDGNVLVCWSGSDSVDPNGGGTTASPGDDATDEPGAGAPPSPMETVLPTGDMDGCQSLPPTGDDCATVALEAVPPDATEPGRLGSANGSTNGRQQGTVSSNSESSVSTGTARANGGTDAGTSASDNGDTVTDGSPDAGDGGEPGVIGFCDDLGTVLQQHADPTGEHAGSMASGSAEATTGGEQASASAAMGWADGQREGQVSLSVDPTPPAAAAGCLDPGLETGPDVTCQTQTLDDGTVVRVGHGTQDGAERVAVRYDRPDGSVVWATADEATNAWWQGDRGVDALTAPPMNVDDLVAMALDDAIK